MRSELKSNAPNFFVVGAPKTGTTALCQYLGEHESIFITNPKELFYWCQDFPNSKSHHGMTSLENYLSLFDSADPQHKRRGEGSTTYMQSAVAIEALMEFNPDAKVIAMLRNPIEVAHGMHGELIRHFLEDEPDFEKAWGLQGKRKAGQELPKNLRMDHQLLYGEVARYEPQLQRLFEYVPESQRLVIIFDDFVSDTRMVYQQILELLDLPDDGRTEFPRVHAAKVFRNQFAGKMYHDPPAILEPLIRRFRHWFAGSNGALKKMISSAASKKKPRAPLRPEFRAELVKYFEEDVRATSRMLDRDLMHWIK